MALSVLTYDVELTNLNNVNKIIIYCIAFINDLCLLGNGRLFPYTDACSAFVTAVLYTIPWASFH